MERIPRRTYRQLEVEEKSKSFNGFCNEVDSLKIRVALEDVQPNLMLLELIDILKGLNIEGAEYANFKDVKRGPISKCVAFHVNDELYDATVSRMTGWLKVRPI